MQRKCKRPPREVSSISKELIDQDSESFKDRSIRLRGENAMASKGRSAKDHRIFCFCFQVFRYFSEPVPVHFVKHNQLLPQPVPC